MITCLRAKMFLLNYVWVVFLVICLPSFQLASTKPSSTTSSIFSLSTKPSTIIKIFNLKTFECSDCQKDNSNEDNDSEVFGIIAVLAVVGVLTLLTIAACWAICAKSVLCGRQPRFYRTQVLQTPINNFNFQPPQLHPISEIYESSLDAPPPAYSEVVQDFPVVVQPVFNPNYSVFSPSVGNLELPPSYTAKTRGDGKI